MKWAKSLFPELPHRFHSLHSQTIFSIIIPLSVVIVCLVAAAGITYHRIVISLLTGRNQQLAALSAARVTEVIEGYARVLETFASSPDIQSMSPDLSILALEQAAGSLDIFNGGVIIADKNGKVLTKDRQSKLPINTDISALEIFQSVRDKSEPEFSDVILDEQVILVAVPIDNEDRGFLGIILGAIRLQTAPLSEPVKNLRMSDESFAYLVDGEGRVIFHPDPTEIGADYRDRPAVSEVLAGNTGGTLWRTSSGDRFLDGFAPLKETGWGLIFQESWETLIDPVQFFDTLAVVGGLIGLVIVVLVSWKGVERIVDPVRKLAGQTSQLAAGETIIPLPESGIREVDELEGAFLRMAARISAYRAGLRRYVGAITKSQEDERRRIARELHDETVQSLLAISRRLELYQAESDPAQRKRLDELQEMVTDTLSGVRQINRDLRPLLLEDLGLIPALRQLVGQIHEGVGAIPHAKLEAPPEPIHLDPEQELALFRIAQEALTNVRKHARATGAKITLTRDSNEVGLIIADDGEGFVVPATLNELAQEGSYGLMGIQERVWAVGGRLTIKSEPGKGTQITVVLPLDDSEGAGQHANSPRN